MENLDYKYISKSVTRGEICVLCLKRMFVAFEEFSDLELVEGRSPHAVLCLYDDVIYCVWGTGRHFPCTPDFQISFSKLTVSWFSICL